MIHFFRVSLGYLLFIITSYSMSIIPNFDILGFAFGIIFGYPFAAQFAIIFISITEIFKLRNILYYLIFGAMVAIFASLTGFIIFNVESKFNVLLYLMFILSGAAGGFVYWAIAGRQAGIWIKETTHGFVKNMLTFIACIFFTCIALLLPVLVFVILILYIDAGIL